MSHTGLGIEYIGSMEYVERPNLNGGFVSFSSDFF